MSRFLPSIPRLPAARGLAIRRAHLLPTATALLTIAAVACLVIAFAAPLDHPDITAPTTTATPSRHPTTRPLSDFEPLFTLDLRKPLIDAPKLDPAAEALTTDSPLPIRLSGTIIEPGRSTAIFSTGLSKTVLRHVGQDINGAEVVEISPDSVTLRYQGQLRQIKIEKSPIAAPLSSTPPTTTGG